MPKKKSKNKFAEAAYEDQRYESRSLRRARLVKWASISIIIALVMSLLAAAVSVAPSSAATAVVAAGSNIAGETPAACEPVDTDGDGQANDVDSDIDGDLMVNGLDSDIDGDGTPNVSDGDPAATNCGKNAPPPAILPEPTAETSSSDSTWIALVGVGLIGLGYLVLRKVRAAKK